MTQTTHLASFGPIFVVTIHPHPPCTFKIYVEPKNNRKLWLVHKEKNILGPDMSFGPVLVVADHHNPSRAFKTIDST